MTAALSHLSRTRTPPRTAIDIQTASVQAEPAVADQRDPAPDRRPDAGPDSSVQLLILSAIWAALVGSGCLLAQPWRTGAFEMTITVATLFGLGAVLGLVLLVGFFQETGAAIAAGASHERVRWRYARIGVAALLVAGTVFVMWSDAATRVGFGRVQDRYDSALDAYLDEPTGSVRIAGVSYLVDADGHEVRFDPTDEQMWGPPSLVWVRDGSRPNHSLMPSPTELGGGWYME